MREPAPQWPPNPPETRPPPHARKRVETPLEQLARLGAVSHRDTDAVGVDPAVEQLLDEFYASGDDDGRALRALLLAALTFVLALPVGLGLAWVLLAVINVEAFGWRLPLRVFPWEWLRLGLLALLAAGLASLWPAWRLGGLWRKPSAYPRRSWRSGVDPANRAGGSQGRKFLSHVLLPPDLKGSGRRTPSNRSIILGS